MFIMLTFKTNIIHTFHALIPTKGQIIHYGSRNGVILGTIGTHLAIDQYQLVSLSVFLFMLLMNKDDQLECGL